MNASSMCVSCIISKQEKLIRQYSDETRKSEYMHRILEIFYRHGQTQSAPWIAEQINLLYEEFWGAANYIDFSAVEHVDEQTFEKLLEKAKHECVSDEEYLQFRRDLEQAREVGLTDLVPCIGNGNAAPGTVINRLSEEAKRALFSADVIISKGQGNFESLYGEGLDPYYLFLCKCELFVYRFGLARYESVFAREERIRVV